MPVIDADRQIVNSFDYVFGKYKLNHSHFLALLRMRKRRLTILWLEAPLTSSENPFVLGNKWCFSSGRPFSRAIFMLSACFSFVKRVPSQNISIFCKQKKKISFKIDFIFVTTNEIWTITKVLFTLKKCPLGYPCMILFRPSTSSFLSVSHLRLMKMPWKCTKLWTDFFFQIKSLCFVRAYFQ